MKTNKQTTPNIKLSGDEIKTFKSMIEKVADSDNKIGFKSDGLTKDEKELVNKIDDEINE